MSRRFDVVIWGATGFTGRLVAEHLCERYGVGGDLRWAIAGRNEAKLEAVRDELKAIDAAASELPIVLGDSFDEASLRELAASTQVVCTTVGPYLRYGSKLVAACVAEGTDYCDLTGESPWIRQMIDRHHDAAQEAGCRIVHCCGFDSIPSDIGAFVLQREARARFGKPMHKVRLYVGPTRGGFSGGTVASMMEIVDQARDPQVRRVLFDPYALNPPGERRGPDGRDPATVSWAPDVDAWRAPFLMGPINTRVVRRSNALLDHAYGRDFKYQEYMTLPGTTQGWVMAQAITLGIGAVLTMAAIPATRWLLESFVLPAPGEGPSQQEREAGFFKATMVGKGENEEGRPVEVRVRIHGERDPGYGATARMLGEAAVCLAHDRDALPERAGILTPASAMGDALVERLEANAAVTFKVDAWS